ncbi:MAG: Response regulator consisting of a CheY-like receiver domain and a winged-helix DNA-binding [Rhodospirillaceae bacterium]|nr:MAG: Response regulator consisting of a CheY-like receiver domain and a winged-helix DNA-binding [Rhodospirillaceae bacterium]TNC94646.1 MAG: Response regulator consisting of a CheY-like receiver domain and a winged-helix DNA-binding domain [Stygiobacter sp.]
MQASLENIRLVIADPSQMVRTGLKGALFAMGFRAVSDTASYVKLHDLIEQDSVDLLIASTELEGNDVGFLIREMRDQRLGNNPFPVTISLLSRPEPDYVKRIIDAGCDDLLLTPVSPEQLILRIEKLCRTRKPFVVTHDYTGPDRRAKQRAFDSHSAPMLEVPNPLKIRAENGVDGTRLQRMVSEASSTLNRMKIERYAVQIDWLSNHIHGCIRDGKAGTDLALMPHTNRLVQVAEDMIRRMKRSPSEALSGPVADLLEIAHKLDDARTAVGYSDLDKLNSLAKGLLRSLGSPRAFMAVKTA